ncbi:MAG TPA: 50S ribosomal protein L19 [Candidatus Saccharimonadales bacterium]|nr:50S ribosomal protein L19 [Candidatus Saccharimonadales bacterium]
MSVIKAVEKKYMKPHVVDVRSGDTVKVHQKVREGNKERVQVFEGLVIRTSRKNSLTASITVRRIASGVGVEKTYLLHSPTITKVQVVKRSKVRRNYLSYMRERTGKSARLSSVDFDQEAVNKIPEPEKPPEQPEASGETREDTEPKELSSEKTESTEPEQKAGDKKPEGQQEKPAEDESADSSKPKKAN